MKYIIGSGWWCPDVKQANVGRTIYGDESIRTGAFHHVWYEAVNRFTDPERIIIIDSDSPVKPPLAKDDNRLMLLSLNENAGHSTSHSGKFCGWTRSVLLSLTYADMCDCEYYVYIEQDALVYGENIIEDQIRQMRNECLFGRQPGLVQPLQQSFFILKRAFIGTFLARMFRIKATDNRISPERKFAIASSAILSVLPEWLFYQPNAKRIVGKIVHRLQTAVLKALGGYGTFNIGYGRHRPIQFDDKQFYFQHGSKKELRSFSSLFSANHQKEHL